MSTAIDTRTDELNTNEIYTGIHAGDIKFSMPDIEVDGIYTSRPSESVYGKLFMSLKDEFMDDGEPLDTGEPYHHDPTVVVSDKHWLRCKSVINVGTVCPICYEIAE